MQHQVKATALVEIEWDLAISIIVSLSNCYEKLISYFKDIGLDIASNKLALSKQSKSKRNWSKWEKKKWGITCLDT